MDTDVMINQFRYLAEKHRNDKVMTFGTRWSDVCTDVANRLEEQEQIIKTLKKELNNDLMHQYRCLNRKMRC